MKVRWDDGGAATAYANMCSVGISAEEITLRFGMTQREDAARREATVVLSNSIVLNPATAKRLALVLAQAMAQYRLRSGPDESAGAPIQALMERVSPQARLPLERVAALGCGYLLSGSFKIHRGGLLGNRYLMTLDKRLIGERADARVLDVCRALGMPEALLAPFAERLAPANYVHFGFEQGSHGCTYKVYMEYWTDWREELEVKRRSAPFVGGYGYKWEPASGRGSALTRYTCHPLLPIDAMLERVAKLYGAAASKPVEVARNLLEAVGRRLPVERMLYLEADEEGSPRRSFDINLLKAQVLLSELHPLWLGICGHYGVEPEAFHALFAPIRNEPFAHIQGGVDREGRDFITIYYGAERH